MGEDSQVWGGGSQVWEEAVKYGKRLLRKRKRERGSCRGRVFIVVGVEIESFMGME
jgi:hypothetical protein